MAGGVFTTKPPGKSWELVKNENAWASTGNLLLLFSGSVMSDSLQLHGLQYSRLSCPSPTPRACSNSYPSSWWCHPTISFSVVPFSSCPKSFPASRSFLMSWKRVWPHQVQSIGASASAAVLLTNIQDWFPLALTALINSLVLSFLYGPTLTSIHDHWKNHSFD